MTTEEKVDLTQLTNQQYADIGRCMMDSLYAAISAQELIERGNAGERDAVIDGYIGVYMAQRRKIELLQARIAELEQQAAVPIAEVERLRAADKMADAIDALFDYGLCGNAADDLKTSAAAYRKLTPPPSK